MSELEDKLKDFNIPLQLDAAWRRDFMRFVDVAPDDFLLAAFRIITFELAYRISGWSFNRETSIPSHEVVRHGLHTVLDTAKKSYKGGP